MKFWIIVFVIIVSGLTYGLQNEDVLGEKIAKSVTLLRSTDWVDTPVAYAEAMPVLGQVAYNPPLTQDEITLDMKVAEIGLVNYIQDIPKKGQCGKARELLIIRKKAALRDKRINTDLAKRWSGYVRENYCLTLPEPDDYFKA
jgi:hypothetical protein